MTQAREQHIKGVFSTQEIKKIGTGTTTRRTVYKSYWFVESLPDGQIECQPLNSKYVPSGPKRFLTIDELMDKFSPEPEFYMSSVFPKMMELQKAVNSGDGHRKKNENFAAEHEYNTALDIDLENIQANFGIGLTYLQRGEEDKAKNIFERLVRLEGTFEAEHKHLFNEFGISLRKNKMLDEALTYYEKAVNLTENDENLYFNLARTYLELKEFSHCSVHLLRALEINPKHELGLKLLEWMQLKSLIPSEFEERVQAIQQETQQETEDIAI